MLWIILIIFLVLCVILPGAWVKYVMKKYSEPADRYSAQGSGGELARHLLDRFDLTQVKVEETSTGDHYASRNGMP
jgi:hypothetical protein